jgi:transposase-like protein
MSDRCLYDISRFSGRRGFKGGHGWRVRVSRERREQLLREFATSGISARRFAQLAGVNPVTFYSWVQKQRASGTGAPVRSAGSPVSFMEAVFASAPAVSSGSEAPLVVHLGGGARAEVASRQGVPLLAQLLVELSLSKASSLTHA